MNKNLKTLIKNLRGMTKDFLRWLRLSNFKMKLEDWIKLTIIGVLGKHQYRKPQDHCLMSKHLRMLLVVQVHIINHHKDSSFTNNWTQFSSTQKTHQVIIKNNSFMLGNHTTSKINIRLKITRWICRLYLIAKVLRKTEKFKPRWVLKEH
jgi:hypothetical protein